MEITYLYITLNQAIVCINENFIYTHPTVDSLRLWGWLFGENKEDHNRMQFISVPNIKVLGRWS